MSTIVYALWHDSHDYGASQELRGLYFSEEEALRDLPTEVVEWFTASISLSQREEGYVGEFCTTRRHFDYCCSVEEVEILERAAGAIALPERPHDPRNRLFSSALMTEWMEQLRQPSPFDRDRIKASLHTDTRSAE